MMAQLRRGIPLDWDRQTLSEDDLAGVRPEGLSAFRTLKQFRDHQLHVPETRGRTRPIDIRPAVYGCPSENTPILGLFPPSASKPAEPRTGWLGDQDSNLD